MGVGGWPGPVNGVHTSVHLVSRTLGKVWSEEAAALTQPTSAHPPKDHSSEVTGELLQQWRLEAAAQGAESVATPTFE